MVDEPWPFMMKMGLLGWSLRGSRSSIRTIDAIIVQRECGEEKGPRGIWVDDFLETWSKRPMILYVFSAHEMYGRYGMGEDGITG